MQPAKSKTPFVIAAAATVALAAGGVFLLLKKNSAEPAAKPDNGSQVIAQGSQETPPPPPPPDNKGSAMTVEKGSAGATVPENKGSATPENKGSATVPENKGSAEVKPEVVAKLSEVKITSVPPNADIMINGVPTGKKTPATLNLPMGKDVNLSVKLSGHHEYQKALAITGEKLAFEAPLVKRSGGGTGKGSGAGKGSGKGSSSKTCDTCLERPD